eukprot:CAMPEP_0179348112 /NCGR_PEP_ID=MMETSP0797-20121207/73525_1 /TAXON_ID=47934 /ORGANISM="Dinophysis acuminata, Strain DAEP01" /LENGTH=339 /DNA_ID=CAMNT_0021062889 /DNA_START=101 /DNA_END=1119 /DNA_ORIENTATION=-
MRCGAGWSPRWLLHEGIHGREHSDHLNDRVPPGAHVHGGAPVEGEPDLGQQPLDVAAPLKLLAHAVHLLPLPPQHLNLPAQRAMHGLGLPQLPPETLLLCLKLLHRVEDGPARAVQGLLGAQLRLRQAAPACEMEELRVPLPSALDLRQSVRHRITDVARGDRTRRGLHNPVHEQHPRGDCPTQGCACRQPGLYETHGEAVRELDKYLYKARPGHQLSTFGRDPKPALDATASSTADVNAAARLLRAASAAYSTFCTATVKAALASPSLVACTRGSAGRDIMLFTLNTLGGARTLGSWEPPAPAGGAHPSPAPAWGPEARRGMGDPGTSPDARGRDAGL